MNRNSICFCAVLVVMMALTAQADQASPNLKPIIIDEAPPELRNVKSRLWTVNYSPKGDTLAVTAGWDNPREPGELVLWDVATQRTKLIRRQEATIRTAAFSGDGKILAIGDFAGATRLLDPGTGKIILTLPKHAKTVNSVVFTPDDKTLVTGSFDETIKFWDVASGKEQYSFSVPREGIVKVALSSDNHLLAAVTWPGKVHVWDLSRREELYSVPASRGQPGKTQIAEAVAFVPNAKTLITGSWDTTLRLWDDTGKPVRDFVGHDAPVQGAVVSPDGKTMASGDAAGTVMLWNLATGQRSATLKAHTDRCFGLAFSPDGKHLATAGWDRVAKIWDLASGHAIATFTLEKP